MGRWETGFAVANGKASITIIFDDDVAREEIRRRDAALPRLTVATLKILKD
jgi:nucleoside 2-deoxyribosyltransferase